MTAYIEAQGSLLRLVALRKYQPPPKGGGKRNKITGFSANSRRRLMRFMARLKVAKIRATFITLTFSGVPSNEEAKCAFKRFSMRLRRKFKLSSAVWRCEPQERGAPHFHVLVFNLPFWQQKDLQATWEKCTREARSIVDIRLVHGTRSVMSYVSKYIAKKTVEPVSASLDDDTYQHVEGDDGTGRVWGYINKKALPLGKRTEALLGDAHVIKSLSSLAWAIIGNDNPYNSLSFHLFADNATWLCERAFEEGGIERTDTRWLMYKLQVQRCSANH